MNSLTSLSSFFDEADKTTLNNCDRETIHLSGKIQGLGAILIVAPHTFEVIGASENAAHFLGCNEIELLGKPLGQIDEDLADQVLLMPDEGKLLHQILEYEIRVSDVVYDAVAHLHSGKLIIEFVPNAITSTKDVRTAMRRCSRACSRILQADNFGNAQQIAVDSVREITGFSRAKFTSFMRIGRERSYRKVATTPCRPISDFVFQPVTYQLRFAK